MFYVQTKLNEYLKLQANNSRFCEISQELSELDI